MTHQETLSWWPALEQLLVANLEPERASVLAMSEPAVESARMLLDSRHQLSWLAARAVVHWSATRIGRLKQVRGLRGDPIHLA
ncbi:hypothetical protein WMF37_49790 [Sorangium sp. So ce291]|uniref:hypothetical protein n=1 Tax=Sorangium sp. So ce291 TaxID=3133294 RepID=UPI003F5E2C41